MTRRVILDTGVLIAIERGKLNIDTVLGPTTPPSRPSLPWNCSSAGGVVLVEGERGIGKTALLREGLSGASAAGCRMGWATADELGRDVPLGVMLDCLRVGGWVMRCDDVLGGGPLMPSSDPVLAAAERLLAFVDRLCMAGSVVMVAEDLQMADEASVLVWQRLCAATCQIPLLLPGSCRPTPSGGTVAARGREPRSSAKRSGIRDHLRSFKLADPASTAIASLRNQRGGARHEPWRPGPRPTR